jgi:hypothetical protein
MRKAGRSDLSWEHRSEQVVRRQEPVKINQQLGWGRIAKHLKSQMPMLLGPHVLHYTPVLTQEGCLYPRYRTFLITPLSSTRRGGPCLVSWFSRGFILVFFLGFYEVISSPCLWIWKLMQPFFHRTLLSECNSESFSFHFIFVMQIKFMQKCCRKVLTNPNGISSHSQSMGSKHTPYILFRRIPIENQPLLQNTFL